MSGRTARINTKAEVAISNEKLTRERVDAIEAWATKFTRLTLKERLRWLLTGR